MLRITPAVPATIVAALGLLTLSVAAAEDDAAASVVYLVRHAETDANAADPSDPPLSVDGQARADALMAMLADANLLSVHSTDLRRTRSTADPVAEAHAVEVETYDPFDSDAMGALVKRLRTTPGSHLVVGHSNTTPTLVEALGGNPKLAISEDEYDRLYIVTVGASGEAVSIVLRY